MADYARLRKIQVGGSEGDAGSAHAEPGDVLTALARCAGLSATPQASQEKDRNGAARLQALI